MTTQNRIKLKFTGIASRAIVEQADYYREQSGSALADRFRLATQNAVDSLFEMTERGTLCHYPRARLAGLRWIPIPKFPLRVFYLFEKQAQVLRIVHVVHNKRDVDPLLHRAIRSMTGED